MQGNLVKLDSLDNQALQVQRVLQETLAIEDRPGRQDNRATLEIRVLLGQQDQLEILVLLVRPVPEVRPDREDLLDYLELPDLQGLRDCLGHQDHRDPLVRRVQ